jgi:hypothetical protein
MITGYFDESGTHEDAVVTTVAGFIASPVAWDSFNQDWQSTLERWSVSCLHMRHFAHSLGEYKQFKGDEASRRNFLGNLLACIMGYCRYGCAVSIIKKDHRDFCVDGRFGSVYTFATQACLSLVDMWTKRNGLQPPIGLVLETGCEYSSELIRHLEELERPLGSLNAFGPISFGTRLQYPGLQAADLLAYEQGKYFTDSLNQGRAVALRLPYKVLQCVPHDWKLLGAHDIMSLTLDILINDLVIGDLETVRKLHPQMTVTIDGKVVDFTDIDAKS